MVVRIVCRVGGLLVVCDKMEIIKLTGDILSIGMKIPNNTDQTKKGLSERSYHHCRRWESWSACGPYSEVAKG